jgi:hypothetical protein
MSAQYQQQQHKCRLAIRTGSSLISIKRILLLIIIIFNCLIIISAIEHDSLECEKTGNCPEPSHTVIKLHKRDDELARRIAAEHGMVVKVSLFLTVNLCRISSSFEISIYGLFKFCDFSKHFYIKFLRDNHSLIPIILWNIHHQIIEENVQ